MISRASAFEAAASRRTARDDFARRFQQHREEFFNFARAASRKKADEIRIAHSPGPTLREILDHRMADENRAQARGVIQLRFERKDAEHQVEVARHVGDASAVPGPNLRADIVNDFRIRRAPAESTRDPQIEAGIIDENDGIWLRGCDFLERLGELFPEISVMLDHFPQAHDRRGIDPIADRVAGNRLHPRAAASMEFTVGREAPQRMHQGGAMFVSTRFARDEINSFSHAKPN